MNKVKIINHCLENARQVSSVNYNQRPDGCKIRLLVLHNISLPPGQYKNDFVEKFFTNALDHSIHPYFRTIEGLKVSSHLFIRRDGEVIQFVPFDQRAWHAGASCFDGEENCNDFSIGIELEGQDDEPYERIQYDVLLKISRELMNTYPEISPAKICGHSDISSGRKTDPGAAFDWKYFRRKLS